MGQALAILAGAERLALEASQIAEVLRVPPLARVPNAPAALAGLANVRGVVVPVVSLSIALGGGEVTCSSRSRLVLLDLPDPVAVLVDEVLRLAPEGQSLDARPLQLAKLLEETFTGHQDRRTPRPAAIASDRSDALEDHVALLAFGIERQEFALPLDHIIAVMALPENIAEVPRTDSAMLGMAAWRGRLLPLVSLPVLLDLPQTLQAAKSRVVVARLGGASVGLVVSTLTSILRVPRSAIDAVPSVLTRGNAEAEITAVCRLDSGRRLVSILNADKLLRDDLVQRLATEEDTEKDDRMGATEHATSGQAAGEQFLVFQLGNEEYGLPIDRVEEVVRAPAQLTRLPNSPGFIEGVMNLRGRVLPVVDQRQRFGSGLGAQITKSRVIVVRIDDHEAGFRVDAVNEVLRVRPDQIVQTPELAADQGGVIDRVAAFDGRMVLLVDAQELLDRAERDMLLAMAKPATT